MTLTTRRQSEQWPLLFGGLQTTQQSTNGAGNRFEFARESDEAPSFERVFS